MLTPCLLSSANDLSTTEWQSLACADDPFLSREFLGLAESTGAASPRLGWQASHLALRDNAQRLQAFMPLYLRHHSFGDFSRDWQWDQAWQAAGLAYYPKLVTAIPFTPSPGPRMALASDDASLKQALIRSAIETTQSLNTSCWQCLFVNDSDRDALQAEGVLLRKGVQFHWINQGYRNFDDYLATFTSDKRKKVKRERRQVLESGLNFAIWHGNEVPEHYWPDIYRQYTRTFRRYGNHPAFSLAFFRTIATQLGQRMVLFVTLKDQELVASAICYRNASTLFGRHWGADHDYPGLHFELCYYQGIAYAIEQRLQRFEPGAQGEHKLARGFEPTTTWSGYWISDAKMRRSVAQFIERETIASDEYHAEMQNHLPFK